MADWIKVSERLPPEGEAVNCIMKNRREVQVLSLFGGVFTLSVTCGNSEMACSFQPFEVLYWQPLPERLSDE